MVDPAGQSINLVDAELNYSTSTLKLVEIDSSVADFYMNLISGKSTGAASIIAMQPWPGIATSSVVADLVFLALDSGRAEINFNQESMVLANDGYGTDVLSTTESASFLIK
jgi:hypothetical protein